MSRLNYKHSEETKKKISIAHIGKHHTFETKQKLSKLYKRVKRSKEDCKKISKGMIGRKLSEETKKKIRLSNLGKIHPSPSFETRKKISDKLKGTHRPEDVKIKISMKQKGKPKYNTRGENSPHWKGGITPINNMIRGSLEYKLWQDSIFAIDGYCCQKCKRFMVSYKLVAHHILNFSSYQKLRFAIDNGITLCKSCHKEFHKIYSKKNNTKEQLLKFIN